MKILPILFIDLKLPLDTRIFVRILDTNDKEHIFAHPALYHSVILNAAQWSEESKVPVTEQAYTQLPTRSQ